MRIRNKNFVFIATIASFFMLMNFCCLGHEDVAEAASSFCDQRVQFKSAGHHEGHSHDACEFGCYDCLKVFNIPSQEISKTYLTSFILKISQNDVFYVGSLKKQLLNFPSSFKGKSPLLIGSSEIPIYLQISVLRI